MNKGWETVSGITTLVDTVLTCTQSKTDPTTTTSIAYTISHQMDQIDPKLSQLCKHLAPENQTNKPVNVHGLNKAKIFNLYIMT